MSTSTSEEIKDADTLLQNKNVSIQAINEHIELNENLHEHGLSTEDIEKLLNYFHCQILLLYEDMLKLH